MKDLSLYIHIPFCNKSKCNYCSFVSFCDQQEHVDEYISSLAKEMSLYSQECNGYIVKTIFVGGGTPSVLTISQISLLIGYVKKYFNVDSQCEMTVECNVDTLSEDKLLAYKSLGVNRISIGAQSMNDKVLHGIGRRHSAQDIMTAVKMIKEHFTSFNVDMMVGLPHQTIEDVKIMTNFLISQAVPHISCYSLILEDGTPLHDSVMSNSITLPSEDETVKMYEQVFTLLSHNGYIRYEVSNFARSGYECRHNMCYWMGGEYIGLGVSAHSYAHLKRFCNTEIFEDYLQMLSHGEKPIVYEEILSKEQRREEYIMLHLRTRYGIDLTEFERIFGENLLKTREKDIDFLKNNGLIEIDKNFLKLQDSAFYVMNSVIIRLI